VEDRVKLGVIQPAEVSVIAILLKNMEFWLIVTSDVDKRAIESALAGVKLNFPHVVYSLDDVNRELSTLA
jgi:hypothetical protein